MDSVTKDGLESANDEIDLVQAQKDKLALRREMRRKKILQTSGARLAKLTGRPVPEHEPNLIYPDPEVEPDMLTSPNMPEQIGDDAVRTLFEAFSNGTTASRDKPKGQHFILEKRLHIVLTGFLAFIISIYFGDAARQYSIFISIGACIIFEFLFFKKPTKLHFLVEILTQFAGPYKYPLVLIISLVNIFRVLIIDIGIIVFIYSILSILLGYVDPSYQNLIKTF